MYVISVHGYNNVCHISAWVEQCMSYQCIGRTMYVIPVHG